MSKREEIAKAMENPRLREFSSQILADRFGVSRGMIQHVRSDLERRGVIPHTRFVIGANGGIYDRIRHTGRPRETWGLTENEEKPVR